jgi:hypothetical protein
MATDELLELFHLDDKKAEGSSSTTNDGPAAKKRRRKAVDPDSANPEEQFSMEELWDLSQYDDQHSIQTFMQKTGL